ncbi:transcription factor Adf-1 [Elysia marginata]|uniref:Transcription factor Adf-1 n=1 Tax=Elysia marginata TaxID=1093978 RepID=A0AAV4EBX7_9GAST|nr:transcription factor Adf-1 [Elysia marginata]
MSLEDDEARKRWKKLRNYFLKSHRETTTSKSGSAGGKKKKWYLHDRMLFILPYISDRNITSNVLPVCLMRTLWMMRTTCLKLID